MEEHRHKSTSDEIDLGQFFSSIGRGFSRLGRSFIAAIAELRYQFHSNRLYFVGIMILGLILGFLYSEVVKKDYYKSTMVLRCDYLNSQILTSTIEKFNLLARERGTEGLQSVLKLDEATAANIQRFEFRPYISEEEIIEIEVLRQQLNDLTDEEKKELVEKVVDQLDLVNQNAYEIGVYVYDPNIVKPLEAALVEYFSGNGYVKNRIVSNRKKLEERKVKLQKDLKTLDSLKKVLVQNYQALSQQSRGSNNVVVGGEEGFANPVDVFKADLEIYEELEKVQERLDLNPDFEVVDGFTSFQVPESASLHDILAAALLLSIVVGYLILGAYHFDRMLANYSSKRGATRS